MKISVARTYKFRLYPSKQDIEVMNETLDVCRFLYNAELEYEKQLYFSRIEYASRNDLNNLIPDWRVINHNLYLVYAQVLLNVSDRVCKAFKKFFEGIKEGRKVGFPRFKCKERYNSFTFPQNGFKFENNKLKLSKIGMINIKLHRKIEGKIKTLAIKKTYTNKWFACFTVILEKEIREKKIKKYVGIDVGINSFYADSEGNRINNPKWFRRYEKRLAFLQRKHSKKQKGSNNSKKTRLRITRLHEKIVNQRTDFLHKESRKLTNNYSIIAVEKLSIKNMISNHYLAKSIGDASWNKFLLLLTYKVEETGGQIIETEASGTSQYCICGNEVKKSLKVRTHKCNRCGLEMDRDVMSAIIIKALALDTVGTAGINACGDVHEDIYETRSQLSVDTQH
ncbi:MAG: RNA-guided endonuclease TnpB family protein [archaeon]